MLITNVEIHLLSTYNSAPQGLLAQALGVPGGNMEHHALYSVSILNSMSHSLIV